MENKFGGLDGKDKTKVAIGLSFGGVLVNAVFAWVFAFGIGMSSQPRNDDAFYFLGVRDDYLPFVFMFSVPASVGLLLLFRKVGKPGWGWLLSSVHFLGLAWYLIWAYSWLS